MDIYYNLKNFKRDKNSVITIGAFDGIHLGHQKIIARILKEGLEKNKRTVLITFNPDPKIFFRKNSTLNGVLSTPEDKIDILRELNLDALIFIPFDKKIANLSPEQFIQSIIIENVGVSKLVIGYDHAFGKDRQGTLPLIKKLSKKYGFGIEVVLPFMMERTIISSTLIRNLVIDGKIDKANKFLGRTYSVIGKVIRGDKRGKDLGYPTANLKLISNDKLLPKSGVYMVSITLESKSHQGMAYIGTKPTFQGREKGIEVHIFGLNKNIYDKDIIIKFLKRIRDDKKFDSISDLKNQLKIDKEETLRFFSGKNFDNRITVERHKEKIVN